MKSNHSLGRMMPNSNRCCSARWVKGVFVLALCLSAMMVGQSSAHASSRKSCNSGDHHSCIPSDGEGSCCARVKVVVKVAGNTENVGDEFLRCYDYDAVIQAFDNGDRLVDSANNGSGNTYEFKCTSGTAIQEGGGGGGGEEHAKQFAQMSFILLALTLISFVAI